MDKIKENVKVNNKIFVDNIIDLVAKFKLFNPLVKIYYNYRQIWLYLFFGVMTTVSNILTYELIVNVFKIDYLISNGVSWIVSIVFAYITNKSYVFKNSSNSVVKQFFSFAIARIFSLVIDMLIMYIGVSVILIDDTIVKVLVNIIVIILNYFSSKFVVFKKKI